MKKILLMLSTFAVMAFGGYYEDGEKADKAEDYQKAAEFYKKAADQGDARAQYSLGTFYYVAGHKKEAYQLFKKSANQGNRNSQELLDIICKESPLLCK